MFRIRKIHDTVSPANRYAINQVTAILKAQFPGTRPGDIEKLPKQLQDPFRYRYRSILFVAENALDKVSGFAIMLHLPDLAIAYLELISAAPGRTGGGIGGVLYERVREEAISIGARGLFFECSTDGPEVENPILLRQNQIRLAFYEKYGARPIINNDYATPALPGDKDLYFLMFDPLDTATPLRRSKVRKVVRAILERKYRDLFDDDHIEAVAGTFVDDPVVIREPRYSGRRKSPPGKSKSPGSVDEKTAIPGRRMGPIPLVVNDGHSIHHVHERGYVEAPVRIPVIMEELDKTGLFRRITPRKVSEKLLKEVHDRRFVDFLKRACAGLPITRSIYPIVFPVRNSLRPPRDLELQVGYYCMDTFTPLNRNAFLAARGAVDCAVTAARELLNENRLAYALVRPPGHHAERRAFGGFCYFNSAAVAAQYLSRYGKVAVLDVDFHHGNGTQDIFFDRNDVLTVSIHGDPSFAYPHFSGFADERGVDAGIGYNLNLPLPEDASPELYLRTLDRALARIRSFKPGHLVVCLGVDTAKADPTGTWSLKKEEFTKIGSAIGEIGLPTLVVQEGGYRTRTLGINVRAFFEGLQGPAAERGRARK